MKRLIILLLLLIANDLFSQESANPVVYSEFLIGSSSRDALSLGGNLNLQRGIHLFTARYLSQNEFHNDFIPITAFLGFGAFRVGSVQNEWGLLYGPRLTFAGSSLSASAGVSVTYSRSRKKLDQNVYSEYVRDHFAGVPFELNLKVFKKIKRRYHIYHLIPVGRPTSFGRSAGLKLFGNLSKDKYIGLGFTYGLGMHKVYTD